MYFFNTLNVQKGKTTECGAYKRKKKTIHFEALDLYVRTFGFTGVAEEYIFLFPISFDVNKYGILMRGLWWC